MFLVAGNEMAGRAIAEDIIKACRIAKIDPLRRATHIKGIMNGMSAVALATGNDTRALESAVYSFSVLRRQMRDHNKI